MTTKQRCLECGGSGSLQRSSWLVECSQCNGSGWIEIKRGELKMERPNTGKILNLPRWNREYIYYLENQVISLRREVVDLEKETIKHKDWLDKQLRYIQEKDLEMDGLI